MHTYKFKVGDRVVYVAFGAPNEGIGGTVVAVQKLPNASGTFGGPDFYLRVILDTAEAIEDEDSSFLPENDYLTQSYIPF